MANAYTITFWLAMLLLILIAILIFEGVRQQEAGLESKAMLYGAGVLVVIVILLLLVGYFVGNAQEQGAKLANKLLDDPEAVAKLAAL